VVVAVLLVVVGPVINCCISLVDSTEWVKMHKHTNPPPPPSKKIVFGPGTGCVFLKLFFPVFSDLSWEFLIGYDHL
jgi:hypothetical protein